MTPNEPPRPPGGPAEAQPPSGPAPARPQRLALVVDDDPGACAWMRAALELAFPGVQVAEAGSLAQGLQAIRQASPDLAVIDLGLPDGSGLDLITALARQPHRTLRVVSTVFADDQHLFPVLRAGAAGYLLKDEPVDRLALLLRRIVAGEPALSAPITRRLMGFFREPEPDAASDLSPREREVLTLLAKGLTIGAVAQALGISAHTAASYTKSVYRKLDVTTRAEATLEATRRGLIRP